MFKKLTVIVHPSFKKPRFNKKLLSAVRLLSDMYAATINPPPFEGSGRSARKVEKYLHVGWTEHDNLCSAFGDAYRIESYIYPSTSNPDEAHIDIRFYDVEMRKPYFRLGGGADLESGEVHISASVTDYSYLKRIRDQ